MTNHQTPFELLQTLAERARLNARPLPMLSESKPMWDGIGCIFAGIRVMVPLREVSEIVPCAALAAIPGAKHWAVGVANIRGTLITVINLAGLLGKPNSRITSQSRILVINLPELSAGILVDSVLGMRHFDYDSQVTELRIREPEIIPYIRGGFNDDEHIWPVFSLAALAKTTDFMNIAA
ncbi:MAG: chemotaxis protein CheW [Pseudomonadota bacterium]